MAHKLSYLLSVVGNSSGVRVVAMVTFLASRVGMRREFFSQLERADVKVYCHKVLVCEFVRLQW